MIEHPEYGEVIQLQGDQRRNICQFLKDVGHIFHVFLAGAAVFACHWTVYMFGLAWNCCHVLTNVFFFPLFADSAGQGGAAQSPRLLEAARSPLPSLREGY